MATDLTDDNVRAMLEAATPGPWRNGNDWLAHGDPGAEFQLLAQLTGDSDYTWHCAALMAAAPDLAQALLDARAELATLRQHVDAIGAACVKHGHCYEADGMNPAPPRDHELAGVMASGLKAFAERDSARRNNEGYREALIDVSRIVQDRDAEIERLRSESVADSCRVEAAALKEPPSQLGPVPGCGTKKRPDGATWWCHGTCGRHGECMYRVRAAALKGEG